MHSIYDGKYTHEDICMHSNTFYCPKILFICVNNPESKRKKFVCFFPLYMVFLRVSVYLGVNSPNHKYLKILNALV